MVTDVVTQPLFQIFKTHDHQRFCRRADRPLQFGKGADTRLMYPLGDHHPSYLQPLCIGHFTQ